MTTWEKHSAWVNSLDLNPTKESYYTNVVVDSKGGKFYFWSETFSELHGPYDKVQECEKDLIEYVFASLYW